RTGFGRRRREERSQALQAGGAPGWHAACLPWMHERGVAMIGCDTGQDVFPSGYQSMPIPVHVVGIVAMGLWLIDNCNLEDLAAACEERGRHEFQFMLATLRMVGGTGSPANPLAVL